MYREDDASGRPGDLTMVGSNSSVMAPRAFSSSPWRVMSKTSVSVGSESLRMSHHSTCRGQAPGEMLRGRG